MTTLDVDVQAFSRLVADLTRQQATTAAWTVVNEIAQTLRDCGCPGCMHTATKLTERVSRAVQELGGAS